MIVRTGVIALATVIALQAQVRHPPANSAFLRAAEVRWAAAKPQNYDFRIQLLCGLCPPFPPGVELPLVRVRDGHGTLVGNWDAATRAEFGKYITVERQFGVIRSQIANRSRAELTFDNRLGYPARAYFDPVALVSDEEFGFQVSAFVVLPDDEGAMPKVVLHRTAASAIPRLHR